MNSNGKIGRLSKDVRDELGGRLENGEPGVQLVEWLNGLPAVREILKSQFDGRPITEQNLSEWKQRGFREWQRHKEVREHLRSLNERAGDLDGVAGAAAISDLMASWLAAELSVRAKELLEATEDPKERWRYLREILGELRQLRRQDHERQRIQLQRERWELERERGKAELMKVQREEAGKQARKAEYARWDTLLEKVPGSGKLKEQVTKALTSLQQHGLGTEEPKGAGAIGGGGEGNDVLPDESGVPSGEGAAGDEKDESNLRDRESGEQRGGCQAGVLNPSESDQIQPNPTTDLDSSPGF